MSSWHFSITPSSLKSRNRISAFLAEITGDSKYTNAALLSAKWIEAHNINADHIVLDTVNGHDCTRSPATWLFTYNSGKYVEGLSVLADVTRDSHWTTLSVLSNSSIISVIFS